MNKTHKLENKAVITFNAESHRYVKDGNYVVGMSTILGKLASPMLEAWKVNTQVNAIKQEMEKQGIPLDKIDSIISARLAQLGQQALVGEIIDIDSVEISEVNNFFDTNKLQYIEPETISFSHIFFDTEKSAKSYLIKLREELDSIKLKDLVNTGGIVFPYQKNYSKKPYSFIVGHFGESGARNIFSLQKNNSNWQGPIKSSLGYHLINVFNKTAMEQLALDDILSEVTRDYYEQLRKSDTQSIISNKILEYQVIDKTKAN